MQCLGLFNDNIQRNMVVLPRPLVKPNFNIVRYL